jgi:hypothetical protein
MGALPRGKSGLGEKLTIHLQLVPMPRKCGSIQPLLHRSSCKSALLVKHRDNIFFTFTNCEVFPSKKMIDP